MFLIFVLKRASDQSPCSFNFTSTTTFELTFESLELVVSALLCVSLELTEGECEFTARVSTEGTQLCLILVLSVWLCPQNPLMALQLGKVTPVFLSHLPSLDEAKQQLHQLNIPTTELLRDVTS